MCSAAHANGLYVQKDTITVDSGEILKTSESPEISGKLTTGGYTINPGDATPGAIVKNGTGELVIDTDLTMNNPFVIDQGTVTIKDADVVADRTGASSTCGLSIADATLKLDNASFTSDINSYSFCIGNRDGGASKLILENGSTVKTMHYLFAGYAGNNNTDYRAGLDAQPATGDAVKRAEIQVLSGSELSAGSSLQFANVDVTVDGAGSVLKDNHRGQTKNQWPESYLAYGDGFETKIDVTGGGALDFNWNVYTSTNKDSRTIINIDGSGQTEDNKKVASSISVAGTAYLSVVDDYNYSNTNNTNTDAYSELNIINGGNADISQLVMGIDAGKAKVTVGTDSTYNGTTMRVGSNGELVNNGTLQLKEGYTTTWPTDGKTGSEAVTELKSGALSVEGGAVTNSGNLTVEKLAMTGNTESTAKVNNTNGTFWVKEDAQITNAEIASTKGTVRFDGVADVSNSKITADAGNVLFNKGANLKGDNEFVSNGSAEKLFFGGSSTAEGNNSFSGQIKMNNLVVKSGTQEFSRSGTGESMSFKNIGFDKNASPDAAININVTGGSGTVFIEGNSEITSLTFSSGNTALQNTFKVEGTLVVRDFLHIGEGVTTEFGHTERVESKDPNGRVFYRNAAGNLVSQGRDENNVYCVYVWAEDGKTLVNKVPKTVNGVTAKEWEGACSDTLVGPTFVTTEAKIIFEIDSLAELLDSTTYTLRSESSPMLTLGDGVSLGDNAKVELMFTENALKELEEYEGPVTFNLEKVTNVADIDLNLVIQEDLGKTAEEVFGTTTFTTGEAGSSKNQITINAVPEPTTATLSLLALAGLCARRRRK